MIALGIFLCIAGIVGICLCIFSTMPLWVIISSIAALFIGVIFIAAKTDGFKDFTAFEEFDYVDFDSWGGDD